MTENRIEKRDGCTVFAGADAVKVYQATALASGLRLYQRTGMKPNTRWTPSAMLATAASITGKTYKRGQFEQAAADLTDWARAQAATIKAGSV